MLRSRLTLGAIILIGLLATPALALAGAINTTGAIEGDFETLPPAAGVDCDLGSPVEPEDYLCDSTSDGIVALPTVIGDGTYTMAIRRDHSIGATEPGCARLTGTMVITTASGTITFTIQDTSRLCLTFIVGTMDLDMAVGSGTGSFAGMTGFLGAEGGVGPSKGGTEMILTASGNIIAGVTPTPTPTATPAGTAAPATRAPTPPVSALPNAALPQTDASVGIASGLVIVLAALVLVGSSVAYVARRPLRR